jgi:hypothetical protein
MNPSQLKASILSLSEQYAKSRGLEYKKYTTALIFKHISDNFLNSSFQNIERNSELKPRLNKTHSNIKKTYEMQSSNSSNALLMNVFCHSKISKWKGIRDLFRVKDVKPIFGYKPGIPLKNGKRDRTEIDLVLADIFVEAKLTESDFKVKDFETVANYHGFEDVFHPEKLPKTDKSFLNYQIIRNLLAAYHFEKRHILICDGRRGDLIKSYYDVVKCVRSVGIRKRCDVIFWQDIWERVGKDIKEFLSEKYGINSK